MTSFQTIIAWLFHGLVQYILYWIPLLHPYAEEDWPPGAWWSYNSYGDWVDHKDAEGRPDEHLIQRWFVMVFGESKALVLEEAKPYVDAFYSVLKSLIGYVRSGFASTGSWLDAVERRVGFSLPFWATNVALGLVSLWNRLPVSIRESWESWAGLWERIKEDIRAWARDAYDYAKSVALWAQDWIVNRGVILAIWWDDVHAWLDWLKGDPYGAITWYLGETWGWLVDFAINGRDRVFDWLGPDFPRLLTFSRDCVAFYYNLWSLGWRELGDLVSSPLDYILDRAEKALVKWW